MGVNIGCVAELGESEALPSLPRQGGVFRVGFGIAELQIGLEEGGVSRGGGGEMAVGGLRLQPESAGGPGLRPLPETGPPALAPRSGAASPP